MKKNSQIDRRRLTPIFKSVLKKYKIMNKGKTTAHPVHDVTATLLNYIFTGRNKMTFDLLDIQELMHFVKVIEREIYGKKKK